MRQTISFFSFSLSDLSYFQFFIYNLKQMNKSYHNSQACLNELVRNFVEKCFWEQIFQKRNFPFYQYFSRNSPILVESHNIDAIVVVVFVYGTLLHH